MSSPRLLLAAMAACLALVPATAQRPRDQEAVAKEDSRAKSVPFRKIEQSVRAPKEAEGWFYLGPEFDQGTQVYRLKFRRATRVLWVDVDARTGRVVQTKGD